MKKTIHAYMSGYMPIASSDLLAPTEIVKEAINLNKKIWVAITGDEHPTIGIIIGSLRKHLREESKFSILNRPKLFKILTETKQNTPYLACSFANHIIQWIIWVICENILSFVFLIFEPWPN